jgi:hypothetical protein
VEIKFLIPVNDNDSESDYYYDKIYINILDIPYFDFGIRIIDKKPEKMNKKIPRGRAAGY